MVVETPAIPTIDRLPRVARGYLDLYRAAISRV